MNTIRLSSWDINTNIPLINSFVISLRWRHSDIITFLDMFIWHTRVQHEHPWDVFPSPSPGRYSHTCITHTVHQHALCACTRTPCCVWVAQPSGRSAKRNENQSELSTLSQWQLRTLKPEPMGALAAVRWKLWTLDLFVFNILHWRWRGARGGGRLHVTLSCFFLMNWSAWSFWAWLHFSV